MFFDNNLNDYDIECCPKTQNKSLKAQNTADKHIIYYIIDNNVNIDNPAIHKDRFGYLTCNLNKYNLQTIISYYSQNIAIDDTFKINDINFEGNFTFPFDNINYTKIIIIKIFKFFKCFKLNFNEAINNLDAGGIIICRFMTKYFTAGMIDIANKYFDNVQQTLAWKKSRLLILSKLNESTFKVINKMAINIFTYY